MTQSEKEKRATKIQGPSKKKIETHYSQKQNRARIKNVWKKAKSDNELGKKVRAMLYDMTKDKKYKEANYQKSESSGIHYTKNEVQKSLSFAKIKARTNAKKQYTRLVKIQKEQNKIPSYYTFKKSHPEFKKYNRSDSLKAKKEYGKLIKELRKKKIKKTSYKEFKKANPHLFNPLTGFDSADIEAFYDS